MVLSRGRPQSRGLPPPNVDPLVKPGLRAGPRISSTHNIHLPCDCLHPHVHPEPAVASNTLFAGSRTHQPRPTNLFNESALSAAERTRAGYRRGPGTRTLIICVRDQHHRLWWDVAAAPMAVLWCPPPRGPTFYNTRAWKTRRWPNSRSKNPNPQLLTSTM